MSEFHTSKDAIDAYNNMEQLYGHTDDRCSKDADLIADDILDWLATINAATFDQSNQEILDRMLAQLDAATPSIDNCDVESSLKAFHKKYAMLFENATAEAGRKILCKRFSTKSRMALESRADSGLDPLIAESHGGQNGMRAGTA